MQKEGFVGKRTPAVSSPFTFHLVQVIKECTVHNGNTQYNVVKRIENSKRGKQNFCAEQKFLCGWNLYKHHTLPNLPDRNQNNDLC